MVGISAVEQPGAGSLAFEHRYLSAGTMFGVGCAALVLEIALARVFSVVLWYHMTYLVISLALLGYGAAGTYLSTRPVLADADYLRTIAHHCWLFSVLAVVALPLAIWFPSDPQGLLEGHYEQVFLIAVTHLALAVPFFFAGAALGFVLMRNRRQTNRLYFADLCGAGLGSFLSVVIINHIGTISAIFFAATLPAIVALAARWKDRKAPRLSYGALVLIFAAASIISFWHEIIPLRICRGKPLAGWESQIIFTGWNIVSRIDVTKPILEKAHFGGRISDSYQGPFTQVLPIYQDGAAPTGVLQIEGRVEDYPLLDYYLQGAPYAIRPHPQSVLVIGVGGGIDVLISEHAGARKVVGVDINPIMRKLLTDRYRDFASALFQEGTFELIVSEGRHYLTKSSQRFDVIQLSGVDTLAALSAGALGLTENYLYTSEAVRDLLGHLKGEGILSYSRGHWTFLPETLKLAITACETLRQMGTRDPGAHFFIVAGGPPMYHWADTMVKATPFTREEVFALRSWARYRQFEIVYDPLEPRVNSINTYLLSSEEKQKEFVNSHPYDVSPTRDDRPFFFCFGVRGSEKTFFSLFLTFGELLLFSVVFVLTPLRSTRGFGLPLRRSFSWLLTFTGLGFGFIAIEIVLIQKLSVFVGGPAYSMAVTLFALLTFSGLGSRLSRRLATSNLAAIAWMIGLLLAVQIAELGLLDLGVPALLVLPHVWRCVASILAIAPLGLLMGMPFPALLAKAGGESAALVPWAWGVNACATVVGSALTMMVSLELGFNLAWMLAIGMYILVLAVVGIYLPAKQTPAHLT